MMIIDQSTPPKANTFWCLLCCSVEGLTSTNPEEFTSSLPFKKEWGAWNSGEHFERLAAAHSYSHITISHLDHALAMLKSILGLCVPIMLL